MYQRRMVNFQGKGMMKTYWIFNRWEDTESLHEEEKEDLNIPGELMNYSDVRLCGNSGTFVDSSDIANSSDRRIGVWREEDVFVAGSGAGDSNSSRKTHQVQSGGIHQC